MKNSPLDDLKDILPKTRKDPTPNRKSGGFFFLCGLLVLLTIPFAPDISEEYLMNCSYIVIPFFVMGIASYYFSLEKTLRFM